MARISEALAMAVQHHQAGGLEAAERICREILAVEPRHAEALHLSGLIAFQTGQRDLAAELLSRAIDADGTKAVYQNNLGTVFKARSDLDQAATCFRRAVELQPGYAMAHYNLGTVFQGQGKLDEASACFRRAIELNPHHAEAHNNLGNILGARGDLDGAIACFQRGLELNPKAALAHYNLGNIFKEQEKFEEAADAYRRALALKPDFAEAHNNLGNVLKDQGELDDAVAAYRRALELGSELVEIHGNLGNAFQMQGKLAEAVGSYGRALALRPDHAQTHNNLSSAWLLLGRFDEAVACCRRALELKPDFGEAHNNLGKAFQDYGHLSEAIASYRQALELDPGSAKAHNNLGSALGDQGKLSEAIALYRRALELKPDYADARSNLLLTLQYQTGASLAELAAAHAVYEQVHAAPLQRFWRPHKNDREMERPLCVGFVSADFAQHPVGYFLIRALENLDRAHWTVTCYSDGIIRDGFTARFQAVAAKWHEVRGWTDKALAERIAADRIDILFDLAGHTAGNRLLAFARKPAPIQVTWAGYAGTTGLKAMDYIVADRHEIPAGADGYYAERVLRLPDGYVCYEPPADAPAVTALPALNEGYVTFGSFNNPTKITSQVVEVWAKILKRVPQSRLVLKRRGLKDVSIGGRLVAEFAGHGIDPARVECLDWSPHGKLLAEYGRIDLALDPFPYNGGLTTCEALWMGVPVITCPGETFASRHSLSHLSNVGVSETIARNLDDYVELALALSHDLPRLAAMRHGLRQRMAASPLCDGKRFAENLTGVMREAWRQWCRSPVA